MNLKGSNGLYVGSPEYFKNINESTVIGHIMWEFSNGSHCVNYKDALDKLCKSIVDVIYEVHSDLKRYAEVLSFFPKEEREETLKFLEKINEVLKFGYSNASTFDACKAYLTLSAYDTRRKSYESLYRVEEAAKKVENGTRANVSFSTGMEYIRKAVDYGISFTIGDDSTKKAFFDDILEGKDRDFLQDVYNFLKFKKEKSSLSGKCFKIILSKEYIEKLNCEAISSRLYEKLKDERSYYEVIKSGFDKLAETIQKDINVDSIEIRDNYLKDLFEATGYIDNLLNKNLSSHMKERTSQKSDVPTEGSFDEICKKELERLSYQEYSGFRKGTIEELLTKEYEKIKNLAYGEYYISSPRAEKTQLEILRDASEKKAREILDFLLYGKDVKHNYNSYNSLERFYKSFLDEAESEYEFDNFLRKFIPKTAEAFVNIMNLRNISLTSNSWQEQAIGALEYVVLEAPDFVELLKIPEGSLAEVKNAESKLAIIINSEYDHLVAFNKKNIREKFITLIQGELDSLTDTTYAYGDSIYQTRLYNRYIREYLENVKLLNEHADYSLKIITERLG